MYLCVRLEGHCQDWNYLSSGRFEVFQDLLRFGIYGAFCFQALTELGFEFRGF